MNTLKTISLAGYTLIAVFTLILGILYSVSSRTMPYHLEAMGTTWENLNSGAQVMQLNFMRSVAAGFITTAVALLILLYIPFRSGEVWSYFAVFALAALELGNILYRTGCVKFQTPANPPLTLLIVVMGVTVLSFILSLVSLSGQQ